MIFFTYHDIILFAMWDRSSLFVRIMWEITKNKFFFNDIKLWGLKIKLHKIKIIGVKT